MSAWLHRLIVFGIVVTGVIALVYHGRQYWGAVEMPALVLLLPDKTAPSDPRVAVWLDAAREEGYLVRTMRDSEFLSPGTNRSRIPGVIVPDQVHKVANNILIESLTRYVMDGGHLMLVYDAGLWTATETYAPGRSRLSSLAGVDYALYDRLSEKTTIWGPVLATPEMFSSLQVPPGKSIAVTEVPDLARQLPALGPGAAGLHTLSGYDHIMLQYDSFVTRGSYDGRALLRTVTGDLAAGERVVGKGRVLFVNLPLGYLKGRTDGLLLHGFLHYFGSDMLQFPTVSPVPDGIGGLIMNWHLDSRVSLSPLQRLKTLGLYEAGPYSIHLTAGPDARRQGDGLGLDVERNPGIRQWLRFFGKKGYEVGSHGGWIHDYFGEQVPDQATPEFEHFLRRNKLALELATGKPVVEYSAPQGNHPAWVTDWLVREGILAYYFTGNSGMAPTRSYRDGILQHRVIWSFPILTYRDTAGFEELKIIKPRPGEVARWLRGLTDFSADNGTTRLIYFHPRGATLFPGAMRDWLKHAAARQARGEFRWYTMAQLARFLGRRDQLEWRAEPTQEGVLFHADHPDDLAQLSWLLPASVYDQPTVIQGQARVTRRGDHWLVVAGAGRELKFISPLTGGTHVN